MATELAKAYVQIIPSAQGMTGNLERELASAGTTGGGSFLKGFIAKLGVAALATKAVQGIANITKEAVKAYADYEQLTGGVETLFGSASDLVMNNASNAFKTAGLSANEYMETVTGFAASLKQSFDNTDEGLTQAAKVADMAVSDMSDNANKMGTSMESIQNAYAGFAKQNYTMLDNLKLGYGGTKTEMERLLADASEFSGIDYNIDNLADVYEAIHVIQTELGITGTTSLEASTTISGSANAMKAAWQNMLVGIADDNADFGALIGNLASTVTTFAGNIMPRVQQALTGFGSLISGLAPILVAQLPGLISTLIPMLISAVGNIGTAIIGALPAIVSAVGSAIIQGAPLILSSAVTMFGGLLQAVDSILSPVFEAAVNLADQAIQGVVSKAGEMLSAGQDFVRGLIDGILSMASWVWDAAANIAQNAVDAAKNLLNIGSPSKVMFAVGEWFSEGMANGIAEGGADVLAETAKLTNAATWTASDGLRPTEQRGGVVFNITTKTLSQGDIDYLISEANRRLA